MTPIEITEHLRKYLNTQLTGLMNDNMSLCFIKPFIDRVVDKNIHKIKKLLNIVTDDSGNVDIESLIDDITNNLVNSQVFVYPTDVLGDIIIGEGKIKINIPIIQKELVFNKNDLIDFKNTLINNSYE